MRQVRFVSDLGEFKAGEVLQVEDQIAVDAIAQGFAVPSIDPIEEPAVSAEPEVVAVPDTVVEAPQEPVAPETDADRTVEGL